MKALLLIAFVSGWLVAEIVNRTELQEAANQVDTAEAAVIWAHHQIDMLDNCQLKTPIITASHEEDIHALH